MTKRSLHSLAKALASREATAEWARAHSEEEILHVWNECPDARPLLLLSAPIAPRAELVNAALACARIPTERSASPDRTALRAIACVEEWIRGTTPEEEVIRACRDVEASLRGGTSDLASAIVHAARTITDPTAAMHAAAAAARALSANDDTTFHPGFAHLVAAAPHVTKLDALAELAKIVRAHLPCPSRAALTSLRS